MAGSHPTDQSGGTSKTPGATTPGGQPTLILGSSSPYRRALLERLGLHFTQQSPEIDESRWPEESPRALALRLAAAKAERISAADARAWVIASDQVAALDEAVLGKPGNAARAMAQLTACSGRDVVFFTAVTLRRGTDARSFVDRTVVRFRTLDAGEIERYVAADQPFDCAGSFRAEGLGSTLFEAIESVDPSAIIGLPLIRLAALLREAGFTLP